MDWHSSTVVTDITIPEKKSDFILLCNYNNYFAIAVVNYPHSTYAATKGVEQSQTQI